MAADLSPETPEDEIKRKSERYSSLSAPLSLIDGATGSSAQQDNQAMLPQVESRSISSAGAETINIHQTIETAEQLRRMFKYAETTILDDLKRGKLNVCIIAHHET